MLCLADKIIIKVLDAKTADSIKKVGYFVHEKVSRKQATSEKRLFTLQVLKGIAFVNTLTI